MASEITGFAILLGVAAILLWRRGEHGFSLALACIAAGAILNRSAVFANGGHIPIGFDAEGARLVWLGDIIAVPAHFNIALFGNNSITAHLPIVGGYYSIGDCMIGVGVFLTVLFVVRRMIKRKKSANPKR